MRTALILIAHGSRQAAANEDLVRLAAELRSGGEYEVVEPSFLELAEPSIAQAASRCVAAGAARVVLVPYFLAAGMHVRRDLQRHRDDLARDHAGIEFRLAEPLGPHPLLARIILERVLNA